MRKTILIQDEIEPAFPEDFDRNVTECLIFKSCIFNEKSMFAYEEPYFSRLQFESCVFNGQAIFAGTGFKSGFVFNNCIFSSKEQTLIACVSSNRDSIEITNNIFQAFFNFSDNFPDAPIIIRNNIFVSNTNLFTPNNLSLDVRDIDCVENNLGKLDAPVPLTST